VASSVRRRGELVRVSLAAVEAELLVDLTGQLLELFGEDAPAPSAESVAELLAATAQPVEAPDDPVLARLLPAAYRDDDEASAEFRRLTDSDLRATKKSGLSRLIADVTTPTATRPRGGVQIDLDEAGATTWMYALTDIRLAFGTRIGITEELENERELVDPDSDRFDQLAVFDWLGLLLEAMVLAVTGD
jgi:Domain of unknown function (DUF2017)